ncbi:MAG: hypothetical protein DRJ03_01030 [Chloroflexi bacterium]|nr:MAG: hypothetical protein DRJ03_01030 [Chloroflexota bacterium]RLI67384.1 MAG: hypothetical protein DRP02_14550 [Candidatus Gerdarchaeota archaeon]
MVFISALFFQLSTMLTDGTFFAIGFQAKETLSLFATNVPVLINEKAVCNVTFIYGSVWIVRAGIVRDNVNNMVAHTTFPKVNIV